MITLVAFSCREHFDLPTKMELSGSCSVSRHFLEHLPAAPLLAEAARALALDFGVVRNGLSREIVSARG